LKVTKVMAPEVGQESSASPPKFLDTIAFLAKSIPSTKQLSPCAVVPITVQGLRFPYNLDRHMKVTLISNRMPGKVSGLGR